MNVRVTDCRAERIARCRRTGHVVSDPFPELGISGTIVCRSRHDVRFEPWPPYCEPDEEDDEPGWFYADARVRISAFDGPPAMSLFADNGEARWVDWGFVGKWHRINRGFRLLQRAWRFRRLRLLLPFDAAVVARIRDFAYANE